MPSLPRISRFILSLLPIFALSGCVEGYCFAFCHDATPVQTVYVGQRDQCQLLAERKIILYEDPQRRAAPKERNTVLLALFSECMHGKDWGVTAPKREGKGGRRIAVQQNAPPIREDDIIVLPGDNEGAAGRVVLPDRLYADPNRQIAAPTSPQAGPLVGQGIGPGYNTDTPGQEEPDYYNYR